jgi:alanine dehydrogenase
MLLLNRSDISCLLNLDDYITIVEEAFRLHSEGKTLGTGLLHINAEDGEFHVKAGGLQLKRSYFALKVNGGFFQNQIRFGMPNIQGAIYLADAKNGLPLTLMDSREITINRTGAATAVAAKYLARPGSEVALICGCGIQGRIQLVALTRVLPIRRALAYSRNSERAKQFAAEMTTVELEVQPVTDLAEALHVADVCVTCTPAKNFFIRKEEVPPGIFIAAVGADSPDKQELDPQLLPNTKFVVDILDQCAQVGELHHALDGLTMNREDVHSELGDLITGKRPGRTSDSEITVFDSTGTALQDVAAAAAVYERAVAKGIGVNCEIAA